MSTQADLVLQQPAPIARQETLSPADLMAGIHRLASDPGTDVAKMESLIRLLTQQQDRQAEAEFNRAMVACQAEMPRVKKDGRTNNGRYATLENVDTWCRKIYQDHGFSVSYNTGGQTGKQLEIIALVRHSGGHKETYRMPLDLDTSGNKTTTQGGGSTLSYGKRYLLCAVFNIVSEGEDNDGNAPVGKISLDQKNKLLDLIAVAGDGAEAGLNKWLNVAKLEDIPASRFNDAVTTLQKRAAKVAR